MSATKAEAAAKKSAISTIGNKKKDIPVSLTSRFLQHFSEQLYSSPNKAFEELLANAWDANARSAYVYLPEDVKADDAAIYVLDDGGSMDDHGLEDLWKVAYSNKLGQDVTSTGRAIIGKFGIGKLATYVLANELTYICKASDGVIRIVTMDYSTLNAGEQQLIENLSLPLREVAYPELKELLSTSANGRAVLNLIEKKVPAPKAKHDWDDEFGGPKSSVPATTGTWTLVILSSLKDRGRQIKKGIVRRMIQTALPLGAELDIVLNGELLTSSKADLPVIADWEIGRGLGIAEIVLPPREGAEAEEEPEVVKLSSALEPYPHIDIPGIGKVTGRIKLFRDGIAGGKSEEHAPSNGFFVNVRGRVTNSDPHFGEKDLSHSAWARFRMTVRADGLNSFLAVTRESFTDQKELRLFRAFLRTCFNKARAEWLKVDRWADSGAAIIESYGVLPLISFRNFVEDLSSGGDGKEVSPLLDVSGISDVPKAMNEYRDAVKNDVREVLKGIEIGNVGERGPLMQYSLARRKVVVNGDHPFVAQYVEEKAQREAIKDALLVQLLTDVHAHEIGIDESQMEELRETRDRVARLVAKIHRRSGAQIASLLTEVSVHSDYRALEIIVGDALEYLGLEVTRIGGAGKPEGIARAKLPPAKDGSPQSYSFCYDAKSSQQGKAQTGNCNVAGLSRHREDYEADHILLVGPDFQAGALEQECEANSVTPIRAADLGKLLILTAEYGAIPLTKLREMFQLTDPKKVSDWVNDLESWLKKNRKISVTDFVHTLETLEETFPDIVSVSVIADRCRTLTGKKDVGTLEMRRLIAGLQILVPDLIQIENDKVVISAHPNKLADAIESQLAKLKSSKEPSKAGT